MPFLNEKEIPSLLVFSVGPGLEPTGESLCSELSRLTPCSVFHVPCDGRIIPGATWDFLEARARAAEVSCLFIYDALVDGSGMGSVPRTPHGEAMGEGSCGDWNTRTDEQGRVYYENSSTGESSWELSDAGKVDFVANDAVGSRWEDRLTKLLSVADQTHEVVFVYDRSHDGHQMPNTPPRRMFSTADPLSVVPLRLEPLVLPFMRSRPIVLRPSLARFNAAQILDRVVSSLPPPPPLPPARATGAASRAATALSPGGKATPSRQIPGQRRRRGETPGGAAAAEALDTGERALAEVSARRAFVRDHFQEKVFLRPSPNDLPMDPLMWVGLRYNAAVISSEPEEGGTAAALAAQLCSHYCLVDVSAPGGGCAAAALEAIRSSAYVIIVLSRRLLADPWALHLIDFVERSRGADGPLNFDKVWVREATLPSCSADGDGGSEDNDDGGDGGGGGDTVGMSPGKHGSVYETAGDACWDDVVEPLLLSGLARLRNSRWAPAPLHAPKPADFYHPESLAKLAHAGRSRATGMTSPNQAPIEEGSAATPERLSERQSERRAPSPGERRRSLTPKSGRRGDSQGDSRGGATAAVAEEAAEALSPALTPLALRQCGSLDFGELSASETSVRDNRGAEERFARVLAAVRRGLTTAVPFSAAIELGGGMEVREYLGPSLQACSVVLNHSAASRTHAADFFFQRAVTLNLSGRPLNGIAVSHLADAMDHNRSLNAICLDNSALDCESVFLITQALIRDSDPDLATLSLKHNNIAKRGAICLARTLELNESLTHLELKPNPCHFDPAANRALVQAIMGNTFLDRLNGLRFAIKEPCRQPPSQPTDAAAADASGGVGVAARGERLMSSSEASDVSPPPENAVIGEGVESIGQRRRLLHGQQPQEHRHHHHHHHHHNHHHHHHHHDHHHHLPPPPVVAELVSETPNEGLALYEVAFIARRLMLPPPPPPPEVAAAHARYREYVSEKRRIHAEHVAAERAAQEAAQDQKDGDLGQGDERQGDDGRGGDGEGGDGEGGESQGAAGAVKAGLGVLAAAAAVASSSNNAPPPAPGDAGSGDLGPAVRVELALTGRSLGVAAVALLSKGIGAAHSLTSLDLRHNPFEAAEHDYDEMADAVFAAEFNKLGTDLFAEMDAALDDDAAPSLVPVAGPATVPRSKVSVALAPRDPTGLEAGAPRQGFLSPPPLVGSGGKTFPLQFPAQPVVADMPEGDSAGTGVSAGLSGEASNQRVSTRGPCVGTGGSPVEALAEALKASPALGELNGLTVSGQAVFQVVRQPPSLCSYEVEWLAGKLGQPGGVAAHLTILSLRATDMTSRKALLIIRSLAACPLLVEVDFRHNPKLGGHAVAEPLVLAVVSHPALRIASGVPVKAIVLGGAGASDDSTSVSSSSSSRSSSGSVSTVVTPRCASRPECRSRPSCWAVPGPATTAPA